MQEMFSFEVGLNMVEFVQNGRSGVQYTQNFASLTQSP